MCLDALSPAPALAAGLRELHVVRRFGLWLGLGLGLGRGLGLGLELVLGLGLRLG